VLSEIDLKDGAMIIAEQNLSMLEGKVSRLLGIHAGVLKGGADALNAATLNGFADAVR